jgi:hypothetical protein
MKLKGLGNIHKTSVESIDGKDAHGIFINSKLLGETVFILNDKKYYREFREEHPKTVVYFQREIDSLNEVKDDEKYIKLIHFAKKNFEGWLLDVEVDKKININSINKLSKQISDNK